MGPQRSLNYRVTRLKAIDNGILSIVSIGFPLLSEIDDRRRYFAFGFAGLLALICAVQIWRLRHWKDEPPSGPAVSSLPQDHVTRLRRTAAVIAILTLLYSPLVISELHQLQSGGTAHLLIPLPIIYEWFGYWATVAFVPVVGFFSIAMLARKASSFRSAMRIRE